MTDLTEEEKALIADEIQDLCRRVANGERYNIVRYHETRGSFLPHDEKTQVVAWGVCREALEKALSRRPAPPPCEVLLEGIGVKCTLPKGHLFPYHAHVPVRR